MPDTAMEIYAAFNEEANEGWIWQDKYESRSVVIVTRTRGDGRRLRVFCMVRQFDGNFLDRYNDQASERGESRSGAKPTQRYKIDNRAHALVMNEWYRKSCLGIPDTTQHGKHPTVLLDIVKPGWWHFFPGIRAACQQPDLAIRVGTRLGVVGGWLGLIGFLYGLLGVLHPLMQDHQFAGEPALIAAATVICLAVLFFAIYICLPPERTVEWWDKPTMPRLR